MKKEFNQFEYQNKERDKKYDRVELIVPKGKKAVMQQRAADLGLFNKRNKPNVNEYIWQLVEKDLEKRDEARPKESMESHMNPPEIVEGNILFRFDNEEIRIETSGKWIENEKIMIWYETGDILKKEERVIKYSKTAGDLYVTVKGKKYFFSEFKRQ